MQWGGKHAPDKPHNGVLYYALPCVFESLRLQRIEDGEVLYDASDGELPGAVEQADLANLPTIRVLEERIIQLPWRLDRRYTPVDRYLVFDCEQVYRRRHPSQRKVWEPVQAELRQVVDVVSFAHDDEWTDRSVIRHRFA